MKNKPCPNEDDCESYKGGGSRESTQWKVRLVIAFPCWVYIGYRRLISVLLEFYLISFTVADATTKGKFTGSIHWYKK